MNITGLGSSSLYASLRSTTSKTTSTSGGSSTASDSAAISSAGFAAMLKEQGGGPPEISDDQAATIGSALQEKNAELFAALDSDQDGTLSASELKSGMEALHGSQGPQGPPPSGPPPSGPPPAMSDEDAAAVGTDLQSSNSKMFSALDTNSDGILSADELKTGMDSLFSAMDASGMGPSGQDAGQSGQSGTSSTLSDFQTNLLSELLQSLGQTSST